MEGIIVVVTEGEKFLLARCAKNNIISGKWITMAGTMEEGETPEETARREIKEELGVEPRELEKIGQVKGDVFPLLHVFRTDVSGMTITPDENELLDMRAFTKEEALKLDLAGGTRRIFEGLLK